MPVTINGTTGITTPGIDAPGGASTLAAGFSSTIDADGTISTGTYTPTLTPSNWKSITNGGAFTLAAPAGVDGNTAYTIAIQVTNSATAGTITMSGFTKVVGDDLTTTSGHIFFIYITVFGLSTKIATIVAAQ